MINMAVTQEPNYVMNAFFYDLEIIKAIPPRDGKLELGVEYCAGWSDFNGMGISVLGVWDELEGVPHVFLEDNFWDFADLLKSRQYAISFNGIGFDNKVLACKGMEIPRYQNFDLLRELWIADGLDPDSFTPKTHGGFSLEACCNANLTCGKSGNGAMAPVNWQNGLHGDVITYCLRDVMLLRRLVKMAIINNGELRHPKWDRKGSKIRVRIPEGMTLK